MDSSVLIRRCNEFLEELSKFREEISLKFSENLDSDFYNNLIDILSRNLKILEELKEKMELQGFDTPFIGVGKLKGCDEEDLYEIKSYVSYLRRMVDEKKGVLERVRYAIVSHRIALGHLKEKEGNRRIVHFLPYDGSNKDILFNMPTLFIRTYKRLLNILESEGKGAVSSVTITFLVMEDGKRKLKRVKIEEEDYEGYLKKNYGDVLITSIKKNYTKNKLISDGYVRKTLALTYLLAYWNEIEEKIKKNYEEKLSEHQRKLIERYRSTVLDLREDVDEGTIDIRVLEELKIKRIRMREELERLGLYRGGKPVKELESALKVEREISENLSYSTVVKYLSQDVFKYYLYKTPDERDRSSMFPSILTTPSPLNLKWMEIDGIDPVNVLDVKFLLERELPKYSIPIKNLGGVALYLVHGWDEVERYGFKREDVEEILKNMAPIDKLKSLLSKKGIDIKKLEKYNSIKRERTKRFLDALSRL
ncbi:hypothetical protein CFE53_06515 [Methanofervidicoccus sp. A16]|uniref:DUF530 family protein n=1 Tax=Methanofervidicoccus sp. A16 TaxID=2607662 RepID=UPI001189D02B|nr:DUF530 family protein [Methanofervidicoccus sp. A16]AXI25790.1 hypothetical protein CFE53_06515 [Methanofervidicoccus sp. A16]